MLTKQELHLQMRLLERAFKCRICILDGNQNYLFSTNFPDLDTTHTSEYCASCRKRHARDCRLWDDVACTAHSGQTNTAFYSVCPLGVMNIVGQVTLAENLSFNLFGGIFAPRNELPDNALVCHKKLAVPLPAACAELSDKDFHELPILWDMLTRELAIFLDKQMHHKTELSPEENLDEPPEVIVRNFINGYFRQNLTLDAMAQKLGLTKSHATVRIRHLFGKTFVRLLNERRLENAKWLLRNRMSLSVATIARVSGFPHAPYFFRIFKQYTGMTPREYQRQEGTH